MITIIISYSLLQHTHQKIPLQIPNKKLSHVLIVRAILGALNVVLLYKSVMLLEVYLVTILGNTAPFFSLILSSLILSEQITGTKLLGCLFCFVGIILILDPSSIKTSSGKIKTNEAEYYLGIVLVLLSAIGRSLIGVILKKGELKSRRFRRQFEQFVFFTRDAFVRRVSSHVFGRFAKFLV